MKPEAQKFIKFLKFDPNHSSSKLPLTTYTYATVKKSSYPNLLTEDFTTIAVGAFLVTYDYNMQGTMDHMVRFARSLCQHFPELREQGHPKWREVDLTFRTSPPAGFTTRPPPVRFGRVSPPKRRKCRRNRRKPASRKNGYSGSASDAVREPSCAGIGRERAQRTGSPSGVS